ncbi:MAG: ABC transporter ATP-binding protein [Desulfobacterales bacterium]|nr:ABC transporter ATP-binding protein [Desulfobacterales bacterium]
MEPLLKVRNIETYYGPVIAIKGISLDVEDGLIVAILGANGAGKTTILRTISGFIEPEKGTIEFMGRRIDGMKPDHVVKQGIAHIPEGREIFPDLTVGENLRMGAYTRKDRYNLTGDMDQVMGYFPVLRERWKQHAGFLSGGEQQMLAIGRALLARPKLLLMDEPSLGLSPILVRDIFEIIRRINREEGTTILLVEQNARAALTTAQYGYILEVGRVVMDDTAEELMENEDVKEFYLGIQKESIRGSRRWRRKKLWR